MLMLLVTTARLLRFAPPKVRSLGAELLLVAGVLERDLVLRLLVGMRLLELTGRLDGVLPRELLPGVLDPRPGPGTATARSSGDVDRLPPKGGAFSLFRLPSCFHTQSAFPPRFHDGLSSALLLVTCTSKVLQVHAGAAAARARTHIDQATQCTRCLQRQTHAKEVAPRSPAGSTGKEELRERRGCGVRGAGTRKRYATAGG